MGIMCAPNVANPFTGKNIHSFVNSYSQFIDYLFFLWNGSVVKHQEFMKKLNNRHLTISSISNTLKPSLDFQAEQYIKTKVLTIVYSSFSASYPCSS